MIAATYAIWRTTHDSFSLTGWGFFFVLMGMCIAYTAADR